MINRRLVKLHTLKISSYCILNIEVDMSEEVGRGRVSASRMMEDKW